MPWRTALPEQQAVFHARLASINRQIRCNASTPVRSCCVSQQKITPVQDHAECGPSRHAQGAAHAGLCNNYAELVCDSRQTW